MQLIIKAAVSLIIILTASAISKKYPSIAGLIAVMPLTGALVLIWVYLENRGETTIMQNFAKGALLGLLPTILFFIAVFLCFKKEMPLYIVLPVSFGIWGIGAAVHQFFLK
ncbi:MAG: DUF3147 family protein [Deltaproteobacteria bacterium]|nr:DUF3147 family protein [Deltaproteobacteria bacterium]